jgi:hypothetical protein
LLQCRQSKLAIRPFVQAPIAEKQDSRSLLLLEGDPVARKYPAMSNGQRWRSRGILLEQVVSPEIEAPDVTLL